ncbi:hypothetical protein D3C76_1403820 [compost metagenome]
MSYVMSQPHEKKSDLLKKLIEVADRGQFYNLFLAKKIIINNFRGTYTRSQFCSIESITSGVYCAISNDYVPLIEDIVCTKNYEFNSHTNADDCKTLLGRRVHKNHYVLV